MLLRVLGFADVAICVAVLCFIRVKRQWREYWALGSFLAVRAVSTLSFAAILGASLKGLHSHTAYLIYFYVYWMSFAVEAVLAFFIVTSIYRSTVGPLKGLRQAGMMVIYMAIAIAVATAFSPHVGGTRYIMASVTQLQRVQSVLVICLLAFACYAVRPLGLSWRSKVFGVSLGLGLMAVANLAQLEWGANRAMWGIYDLVNAVVVCATMAIWAVYFAMQEPERGEIDMYSGSALLRLNRRLLG
jgi:uncharacterized protein involved in response to NO